MRKIVTVVVLATLVGCAETLSSPDPTDSATGPSLTRGTNGANALQYGAVGDCTNAAIVDPGTVTVEKGIRKERGLIAECIVTGDITGVIRFTRQSTLKNGDGPFTEWDGPVSGMTFLTVEEFFGDTGFEGTFEGPYNTDWQNLLSGQVRLNRRGTGDFQGMAMVATGLTENFGAIVNESGVIHGKLKAK